MTRFLNFNKTVSLNVNQEFFLYLMIATIDIWLKNHIHCDIDDFKIFDPWR